MHDVGNEIVMNGGVLSSTSTGVYIYKVCVERLEINHVVELSDYFKGINLSHRVSIIVDGRAIKESMSAEVKSLASRIMENTLNKVAFIENSALHRFLVHAFMGIYRPKIKMKMFKSYEAALAWINQD